MDEVLRNLACGRKKNTHWESRSEAFQAPNKRKSAALRDGMVTYVSLSTKRVMQMKLDKSSTKYSNVTSNTQGLKS